MRDSGSQRRLWLQEQARVAVLTCLPVCLPSRSPTPPICPRPAVCCSFGSGVGRSLLTIVTAVAVDFLALGCLVASLGWGLSNRVLRRKTQHSHAVEQSVEW